MEDHFDPLAWKANGNLEEDNIEVYLDLLTWKTNRSEEDNMEVHLDLSARKISRARERII